MKAQDVIPTETYLNIVSQSRNNLHLIALIALHLENECADNKISELDAIGYIYRQAKINKEFLLDGVAA